MYSAAIISLFEEALEGALLAQEIILKYYKTNIKVEYKGDHSPVTQADKLADLTIRKCLEKTNIPIISEEFEVPTYTRRKDYNRFWMVDPLDGTKDFVKKNGEFTINIALIEDTKVVAGLICVPCSNEIYFGGSHYPSVKYRGDTQGLSFEKMLINADRLPTVKNETPIIVASRNGNYELMNQLVFKHFNTHEFKISHVGSSLKLCWLADGKADMYPRQTPCMEWDIAAGQAIVEGAGKNVLDFHTNNPLRYNKESLLSNWFIAK